MGKKQTSQIPNILLSVKDASVAISVSTKMVRLLIASGRLKAVNLGERMTRISLQELTDFAQGRGCNVVQPSPFPPFNNDKREKKKPDVSAKPETGNVNKKAKCRTTPASNIAPEGVTHDSHYTLAEVMRKFGIKYGRFYEVRNRFLLPSVHAWGTTAFRKEDVEEAIAIQRGTRKGTDGGILHLLRHYAEVRLGQDASTTFCRDSWCPYQESQRRQG